MSILSSGPDIVKEGIIGFIDGKSQRTFDYIATDTDHGISDWYCMEDGTATYVMPYENTVIEDDTGTTIVSGSSLPLRGTFSITAGRRYFANKPIFLVDEGDHHRIAPLSFSGTEFAHYWSRGGTLTLYIFAAHESCTVEFFDNDAAGGISNSTPTSTHSMNKGDRITITTTNVNTWNFLKSDHPILVTAKSGSSDRVIIPPASNYVYKRRNQYNRTVYNNAMSNNGNYVSYDTSERGNVAAIGDGQGSDAETGIGLEYLSDTYAWGAALSDYHITAPYPDTEVTVSYHDALGGGWVVGEVHQLNGSLTAPDFAFREGNTGFGSPGNAGSYDGGSAPNLASGFDLWKWESTKPISVIVNDTTDDEERLLGWMSNKRERINSNYTYSKSVKSNIINPNNQPGKRLGFYGKDRYADIVNSDNHFVFDGTNYFRGSGADVSLYNFSFEVWFKSAGTPSDWQYWFSNDSDFNGPFLRVGLSPATGSHAAGEVRLYLENSNNVNTTLYTNNSYSDGNWHHVVCTREIDILAGTATAYIYVDGTLETSGSILADNIDEVLSMGPNIWTVGNNGRTNTPQAFEGEISTLRIYTVALTADQVTQNFNANRGLFGL